MIQDAVNTAEHAFKNLVGHSEREIAEFIKTEFDKKHNPTWQCIVGRSFGSYVTYEFKHCIYFYRSKTAILLFRAG